MRKIALFALVTTTFGWAGMTVIGGCSSTPTVTETKDSGKGKSSSSSSSSGEEESSSSSSSSSTSGSTPTDAGSDAAPATNGNPLKITCGTKECTTDGTETTNAACCWPGGDQTKAVCATAGGCEGDFPDNNFNIACDEKADCKAGVCCWGNGQTICADNCTADNVDRPNGQPDMQICKTDAECLPAGTKCTQKSCKMGETGDTITATVKVCGTPTNCQ